MRPRFCLAALGLFLVVAGDLYAPPPRRVPRELLGGMWKVARAEFDGQPVKGFEDARILLFDLAITVQVQGKQVFAGDYVVHLKENPHELDVISLSRPDPGFPMPFSRKDQVFKGYFELTAADKAKDMERKLEICLAKPDADRPKNLQSLPGKEILHLVMAPARR